MAGFSLGGNKLNHPSSEDQIPPENLFLYHGGGGSGHRTEEITSTYTKGFEIWQQQQQQQQRLHHNHNHNHQLHLYSGATGGLGIFGDDALDGAGAGPSSVAIGSTSAGRGIRGSGGGGISCQDCGNQAKKDCMHMRCRTCCKSRNFQCPTHVKSTWVPAAKRRERHQQLTAAMQQQQQQQQSSSLLRGGGSGDASKRPREITTLVCPRLANTASTSDGGREVAGSLPPEVSSPAMFRCVRVSSINDTDEQYAYETAVNIGGRIFRGILFDQGPESSSHYSAVGLSGAGRSSSPAAIASTATTTTPVGSSLMDPSPSFYPTPINSFFSGTQFFPNPRP